MDIIENFDFSSKDDRSSKRKFLSIYWKCCHVFSRVYKNEGLNQYQGYCPKCNRKLIVPIGKDGSNRRIFIAE